MGIPALAPELLESTATVQSVSESMSAQEMLAQLALATHTSKLYAAPRLGQKSWRWFNPSSDMVKVARSRYASNDLGLAPSFLTPQPGLEAAMHEVVGRTGADGRAVLACARAVHDLVRTAMHAADASDGMGELAVPPGAMRVEDEDGAEAAAAAAAGHPGVPAIEGIAAPPRDLLLRDAVAHSAASLVRDMREITLAIVDAEAGVAGGAAVGGQGSQGDAMGLKHPGERPWRVARLRELLRAVLVLLETPDAWDAVASAPGTGGSRPPESYIPAVARVMCEGGNPFALTELLLACPHSLQPQVHLILRRLLPAVSTGDMSNALLAVLGRVAPWVRDRLLVRCGSEPLAPTTRGFPSGAPGDILPTLLLAMAAAGALPCDGCASSEAAIRSGTPSLLPREQLSLR